MTYVIHFIMTRLSWLNDKTNWKFWHVNTHWLIHFAQIAYKNSYMKLEIWRIEDAYLTSYFSLPSLPALPSSSSSNESLILSNTNMSFINPLMKFCNAFTLPLMVSICFKTCCLYCFLTSSGAELLLDTGTSTTSSDRTPEYKLKCIPNDRM